MESKKCPAGKYLSFTLDAQNYGVAVASVREINRMVAIAPVPESDAHVAGVINLRGRIIPVLDLRIRFGMPRVDATKETCIIVLEDGARLVGVVVDSVAAVIELGAEQIDELPELSPDARSRCVSGIGKASEEVCLLLDTGRMLAPDLLVGGAA